MQDRKTILQNMKNIISRDEPLLGVAVGSGISARYAEKGGADFLMVLNAGIFRMAGVSSTAALLPYYNANKLVMNVGKNRILPAIKNTPVIFGMCGTDTTIDRFNYLDQIEKAGFSGVTNYPSVGIINGILKNHLEENKLSYKCEVEIIAEAVRRDLFTVAFVFDEQQAIQMAQVNADIICINFGWTKGGEQAPDKDFTLDQAVNKTNNIYNSLRRIDSDTIVMVYGGPINSPEAANYLFKKTNILGYIGGSVFERIPLEKEILKTTQQYKMFTSVKKSNSQRLRQELRKKKSFGQLVGKSKSMQRVYSIIDQIADKKVNVLITGESGTGKELVARAIHYYGEFSDAPFVPINTASIPYNLLESELFGHEKGSYTGAHKDKKGKFEIADGGTLFLDEIADMPKGLQAKILRAIEESKVQKVGAEDTFDVDLRVIAATNKDLRKLVDKNKFREDLFYRLNVVHIELPPLRDRKEDIPLLISEFLKENNDKYGEVIKDVTQSFFDSIIQYDWPGNIRELKNVIERAYVLNDENVNFLTSETLPAHLRSNTYKIDEEFSDDNGDLKGKLNILEQKIIKETLEDNDFNISRSAEELNITRKTLRNKIDKYNISENE
ncbi:phosphoenolpyruvate hydrolase family protein [Halanaerobiaceae bacterium Z-7014]|uniref:Phosphoenolpyruvate hydrolase family protein n=1 Tax=Halonatronomonas betaini TaxID=2778430 RepID=A0A931ATW0_9FIRM|nr:phosphoenolpyruvate hydrolase family protein [Halonatronomonas betaini]MBF8436081.1 phosphoenolpyruvate hydrolase family protein [Halonatronomonas betaini]